MIISGKYDLIIHLLLPIIVGIVSVIFEHVVLLPVRYGDYKTYRRYKDNSKNGKNNKGTKEIYLQESLKLEDLSIIDFYRYFTILFISLAGSLAMAFTIRAVCDLYYTNYPNTFLAIFIADFFAHSNFVFLIMLIIFIPIGLICTYIIDWWMGGSSAHSMHRYIIAALVSYIGSLFGAFFLSIGIMIYIIISGIRQYDVSTTRRE